MKKIRMMITITIVLLSSTSCLYALIQPANHFQIYWHVVNSSEKLSWLKLLDFSGTSELRDFTKVREGDELDGLEELESIYIDLLDEPSEQGLCILEYKTNYLEVYHYFSCTITPLQPIAEGGGVLPAGAVAVPYSLRIVQDDPDNTSNFMELNAVVPGGASDTQRFKVTRGTTFRTIITHYFIFYANLYDAYVAGMVDGVLYRASITVGVSAP